MTVAMDPESLRILSCDPASMAQRLLDDGIGGCDRPGQTLVPVENVVYVDASGCVVSWARSPFFDFDAPDELKPPHSSNGDGTFGRNVMDRQCPI